MKRLPVGNDVNIVHGIDGVEEADETGFVMGLCEPGSVIVKSEWSSVGRVMSLEVLHDHLCDAFGIGWVRASVAHRATSTVQILPHHHGHFPHAWVALSWARWDHAIVEDLVVESVRPAWWSVLIDRHRRVVREVEVVQHLEHPVAANREERRSHAADVFLLNAAVRRQNLTLACDFTRPFLQRELFTETVTVMGRE